ncbi:hypothetical protein EXS56_02050 [Candidatus Kaiserbacteria bacterium]|nr:hypothetical protein [Candidatus Kaiserbacteria bacterium]
MTFQKPVLKNEAVKFPPPTEQELDTGVAWAKSQYEKDVDRDLLRVLMNTVNERRTSQRGPSLPDLVTEVVHQGVPLSNKDKAHKRAAYKGAIMKIYAGRSARVSQRAAQERKNAEVRGPPRSKKPKFTEDARAKHKGQLKML